MARADEIEEGEPAVSAISRSAFAIVFGVQVITAAGNTGMQSVLPAIGRESHIPDAMVAAIFSLSALLWAIGSPFWAKKSDVHGRKPLILTGLTGFVVSMICCGFVVSAGVRHLATPLLIFFLFLIARALFGLFGSAANPASQAYLAERTTREKRTGAVASLAGAFGLGTIMGPPIAPLFVLPVVGLAGPLFGFAALAAIVLFWVWRFLPETWPPPRPVHALLETSGPPTKAPPLWKDPRIRPFLIYGLLVSACQTAQYQTLGFIVIDKLGVAPIAAQRSTAIAMMAGAVAGLIAQWGLIQLFRMGPRHLLRWGAGLAAIANLMVALAPSYWMVVAGFTLSSLGYGFARPGFSAGASLAVPTSDQARAAGAVAAVNGLNAVFAPLFVLLYEFAHPAPYLMNMVILLGMLGLAFYSPRLRSAGLAPPTEEETVGAVERNDASTGF
jgi:MFS family permease